MAVRQILECFVLDKERSGAMLVFAVTALHALAAAAS